MAIRKVTRAGRAAKAAASWRAYYEHGQGRSYWSTKFLIAERLDALGPNPRPEDVNAVIGNDTWTELQCDQCMEAKEEVIEFDGEYAEDDSGDYGERLAHLCVECLRAGLKLIE
jgi:hypothetical protein